MGSKTEISWCDATWSPIRGCTRISPGCTHCYAERMYARNLPGFKSPTTGEPFAIMTPSGPHWTGKVELIESQMDVPIRWTKPRRIFVNSMSDTFHEKVPNEWIKRIWDVAAKTPRHSYLFLTKRAKRLLDFAWWMCGEDDISAAEWPGNCWIGVSVENKQQLWRIDELRKTPAAIRFLSLEPLLEDLGTINLEGISWVILGGESGPGARPMRPEWVRSIRDQCLSAGVKFHLKQWGHWGYFDQVSDDVAREMDAAGLLPRDEPYGLGKKAAGNLLDGVAWQQFPDVQHQ